MMVATKISLGWMMTLKETTKQLQNMLKEAGIKTSIITEAKTGSTYVEFKDRPYMGKLRVGDHNERKRYGYRWQIRTDITESYIDKSKGHAQYFYAACDLEAAVKHIVNYNNAVERKLNESRT